MRLHSLILCFGLAAVSGIFTVSAQVKAAPVTTLNITYKTKDKPAKCPGGTHPQGGCVWLIGKALEPSAPWPEMHRLAIVDAPKPTLPAGCDTATTSGMLTSKHGRIHFKAAGYYCPKTDTAWYRYTFNTTDAKRYDLPLHGTIRYVGSSNTETFTASSH